MKNHVQEIAEPAVGSCIWLDGGSLCGIALREGDDFVDSGFAGCEFRTDRGTAINIKVTGRTFQRYAGAFGEVVRIRIEFVGDCEPSTFTGGWIAA